MLDQVNEEIEANIQITREIESEIVKCSDVERALAAKESDLTKTLYFSHFELTGLLTVVTLQVDTQRGSRENEKLVKDIAFKFRL
ncbi:hypothetical protein ACFX14_039296 [Malus domestica]